MDILLIPNLSKKNGYECTCEVIRRMTGYGCSCWMMEESMHEFAGQPVKSFPPQGQKIDMKLKWTARFWASTQAGWVF